MTQLQPFDGHDVTQCAMKVTRAGDGLSAALDAAPLELHHGATVYVLLRCQVTAIEHTVTKATKDMDAEDQTFVRRHTLATNFGTLVPEHVAHASLDAARLSIEKAAGITRLPGMQDGDTET